MRQKDELENSILQLEDGGYFKYAVGLLMTVHTWSYVKLQLCYM